MDSMYIDELFSLQKSIQKRKLYEYRVQLAIAQNPHVEKPEELWEALTPKDRDRRDGTMDKKGLALLKLRMAQGKWIGVK